MAEKPGKRGTKRRGRAERAAASRGSGRGRGGPKSGGGGAWAAGKEWTNPRKERRKAEDEEIRGLQARIAAEAPKSGEILGVTGNAPEGAEGGDGPALTAGLFKDLPISDRTKQGLKAAEFVKMTEIQRGAIPHALCGRDILGEARTGSGKTLAFLVPLLERLYREKWSNAFGLGALVVSPTRELAHQIFEVLRKVGKEHDVSAGCIVGGRSLQDEQKAVSNMNVLIATPGRLLQHLDESPGFDASELLVLVLDEADRILDFGFQETVNHILGHLPTERQTLLFSATLHSSVHRLGRAALRSPEIVSVHRDAKSRTPDRLKQVYMTVPLEKKVDMLFSFLRSHSTKKIIVFVSSCKQVRFLYESFRLLKPGLLMMELHGRQSLIKRMLTFKEFTERESSAALVCTDIAARGVDFPVVDWVVQVDCPDSVDSYIHRVGRTARYESEGHSALFLLPSEESFTEKLKAARVDVKSINPKASKLMTIQGKLASLLASNGDIKHLAQKAFAAYFRAISLMSDKTVFNVQKMPREAFATSLGLNDIPPLTSLDEPVENDKNPLRQRKNQSALQRLKDKIKAKKEAKKQVVEGAAGAEGAPPPPEEDGSEEELQADLAAKKLGKWERRQRRIQQLSASAKQGAAQPEAAAAGRLEEDDLLQPTAAPTSDLAVQPTTGRKRRQKLRSDGKAVGAEGQHTFFLDKGHATSELGLVAEELGAASGAEETPAAPTKRGRQAFLKEIARDLAARDPSDAVATQARLREKRKRKRQKDRFERPDQEETEVVLGSPTSPRSPSRSGVSASESPAPARRRRASGRAGVEEPAADPTVPVASGSSAPSTAGDAALEDLEREALRRLGGGGLFA